MNRSTVFATLRNTLAQVQSTESAARVTVTKIGVSLAPSASSHIVHLVRYKHFVVFLTLLTFLMLSFSQVIPSFSADGVPPLNPDATRWHSGDHVVTESVAWGDVDGDGDLDLAVGNYNDAIKVYLNQDGVLQTEADQPWSAGTIDNTRSVAWGDVDDDGDLDLAAGNTNGATKVYLNQSGVLQKPAAWSSSGTNRTWSVAWGDVDSDGDLDLATGNEGEDKIYLNQSGILQTVAAWSSKSMDNTESVAWGDVEGDGDLDLAVGNDYDENKVYLNQGGILQTAEDQPWSSGDKQGTSSVAWGDVDNDGDLDLAVGNVISANQVYLNHGGVLQKPAVWFSDDKDGTQDIAWGDVDGDGDLDLAAVNGRTFGLGVTNYNKVYVNQAGVLQRKATWVASKEDWSASVAWGDIDGDGDLDLAAASDGQDKIYENQRSLLQTMVDNPWFTNSFDNATGVAWGDVDGDGDLDLAEGNSGGANRVYINQAGVLQIPAAWSSDDTDKTGSVAWGDVDGDGDLDLAVGNYDGPNRLYLNQVGSLQISAAWSSLEANSASSVAWGDVDNDGDLDLAAGSFGGQSKVYLNQAGNLQTSPGWFAEQASMARSVVWGDVDLDGDLDLAVGNENRPSQVYFNLGGVLQTSPAWTSDDKRGAYSVAWGDVDGDGDLDLAEGIPGVTNQIYLNREGVLEKKASWSSDDTNGGWSLAWGDVDSDGDLDLAAGIRLGENKIYLNQGGVLQKPASWSSGDKDITWSVAWGDVDGDGDLDLAEGKIRDINHAGGVRVYLNQGAKTVSLLDSPTYVTVARPGTTHAADFFSTPQILNTAHLSLTYALFDAEGDAAARVFAEFSANGGGQWLPATPVSGTLSTHLTASPYPTGTTHTYLWNAGADLIKSDQVVFRIQVQSDFQHSPILWPAQRATTFPFRVEVAPWFAKVREENGQAVGGAFVYYAGQLLNSTEISRTTPAGLLRLNNPQPGAPLVALVQRQEQRTLRAAHDGWAYRTYLTSLNLDKEGTPHPNVIGAPGQQLVTLRADNPLILFNIVVSVEWDADTAYLAMLEDAFRKASDYLYDVSDGQMAFGQVMIYDNAEFWSHADFQFSTKNIVRPYAYVGGITAQDTAHAIRMGRFWNGNSGNEGNWNEANGYRTLIHEFSHYALYLYDEYFIRKINDNGNFTGQQAAICTNHEVGPSVGTPDPWPERAENASIMYFHYKASEWADNDRWGEDCQNTEQQRVHGKADWQTVVEHYQGKGWVLNTPTTRASVMVGPEQFPRHLLPFPAITTVNGGTAGGTERALTVVAPQGQIVPSALVALYTTRNEQTIAIDQGITDRNGRIVVYGAVKGDRIQGATFDGALAGSVIVSDEATLSLQLVPVGGVGAAAQEAGASPYLSLLPSSDGRGLLVQVHRLAQSALPLNALLAPAEGGGSPQATVLAYNPTDEAYSGAVSLSGVGLGTGRIQVSGGSLAIPLYSTYNLQRISFTQPSSLYAEDGNFALHLPAASLSGGADGYATVLPTGYAPGPLPAGQEVIGSVYEVRLSSANTLGKEAMVQLSFHPTVVGSYQTIGIYFWHPVGQVWQALGGEQNSVERTVSAVTAQVGIYALMGNRREYSVYLPAIAR